MDGWESSHIFQSLRQSGAIAFSFIGSGQFTQQMFLRRSRSRVVSGSSYLLICTILGGLDYRLTAFEFRKTVSQFTGFHDHCSNFPYGFIEKRQKETKKQLYLYLGYLPHDIVSKQLEGRVFERPPAHKAKLALLKLTFVVLG
jgi:hypothetical protein